MNYEISEHPERIFELDEKQILEYLEEHPEYDFDECLLEEANDETNDIATEEDPKKKLSICNETLYDTFEQLTLFDFI